MVSKIIQSETIEFLGSKNSFSIMFIEILPPYDEMEKIILQRYGRYRVSAFDNRKKGDKAILLNKSYERRVYAEQMYRKLKTKYLDTVVWEIHEERKHGRQMKL